MKMHKVLSIGILAYANHFIATIDSFLSPWIWALILLLAIDLLTNAQREFSKLKKALAPAWTAFGLTIASAGLQGGSLGSIDIHNELQMFVFSYVVGYVYVSYPIFFQWLARLLHIKGNSQLERDIKAVEEAGIIVEKDIVHLFGIKSPNASQVPNSSGTYAGS